MSRVSVRGQVGFPDLAGQVVAFDLENVGSPAYVQQTDLSIGNNSVSVPAGAGMVVIKPPSDSAAVLTFKGVNGDTGVKLHSTAPSVISLDETVSTFVINSDVAVTGIQFIWL